MALACLRLWPEPSKALNSPSSFSLSAAAFFLALMNLMSPTCTRVEVVLVVEGKVKVVVMVVVVEVEEGDLEVVVGDAPGVLRQLPALDLRLAGEEAGGVMAGWMDGWMDDGMIG